VENKNGLAKKLGQDKPDIGNNLGAFCDVVVVVYVVLHRLVGYSLMNSNVRWRREGYQYERNLMAQQGPSA
jgi:hypothetical protein